MAFATRRRNAIVVLLTFTAIGSRRQNPSCLISMTEPSTKPISINRRSTSPGDKPDLAQVEASIPFIVPRKPNGAVPRRTMLSHTGA